MFPKSFFPRCWPLTRRYLCSKSFPENAEEGEFFLNMKWQVVGRSDFPSILSVKSDRFFTCNSDPIHKTSLIWAFDINRDVVTNGRKTLVPSRRLRCQRVNPFSPRKNYGDV